MKGDSLKLPIEYLRLCSDLAHYKDMGFRLVRRYILNVTNGLEKELFNEVHSRFIERYNNDDDWKDKPEDKKRLSIVLDLVNFFYRFEKIPGEYKKGILPSTIEEYYFSISKFSELVNKENGTEPISDEEIEKLLEKNKIDVDILYD